MQEPLPIVEVFLTPKQKTKKTQLGAKWLQIIGRVEIPFDRSDRRRVLASAYERLDPSIRVHEQLMQARPRPT